MKAIFFGAGKALPKAIEAATDFEIVAIVDNSEEKHGTIINFHGCSFCVKSVNALFIENYDAIIISVSDPQIQTAIARQLISMSVQVERIFYYYNNTIRPLPKIQPPIDHNGEMRILYDVSEISKNDYGAGIQRVVNNIYEQFKDESDFLAVRYSRLYDKYITSRIYECRYSGDEFDGTEREIILTGKDIILCLDPCWTENISVLQNKSLEAGRKYYVIYDIFPIILPSVPEDFRKLFMRWLSAVFMCSDGVLCTSRAVANDVRRYYESSHFFRKGKLPIYIFNLGFNIPMEKQRAREMIKKFVHAKPTFLMVGTVEPRKNHLQTLKAFAALYKEHPVIDVQLLIIGKDGWQNDSFKEYFHRNDWLQKSILWIKDADDGELRWAYENCFALLYPTQNEGYGLPLVEAAYHGLPVLCNDIPVFHEIAEDNVTYFNSENVDEFKDEIIKFLAAKEHPNSRKIKLCTWEESARQIHDIVNGRAEPYMVL